MEFFRDRHAYLAVFILIVLQFSSTDFSVQSAGSLVETVLLIISLTLETAYIVYFLKFLANGYKKNRKSPYNIIPFNAWSYIWRLGLVFFISFYSLVPILMLETVSFDGMVVMLYLLVVNIVLIFLFYCREKKKKLNEIKMMFSSISF